MNDTSSARPWLAPNANGPVRGAVSVPGSKSMTNRALVCAALTDGVSVLRRPLQSRDSALMQTGLTTLGAQFSTLGDSVAVTGAPPPLAVKQATIDVGLAGTVARFLPPVAALATNRIDFGGDEQMRRRPIAALLDALRALGADIDDGGRNALPFAVVGGGGLPGGTVQVDAHESSQMVSGLLLASPYFRDGIDVTAVGAVPSAPHIAMTVAMMRRAGADVDAGPNRWRVQRGAYAPRDTQIEPDATSASYFFAAAAITGGAVMVTGWPHDSVQPSDHLIGVLTAMGVR
ncbi:MAG: 3-phosphoshikimate 1-carboxyvinyltransferase, partial [Mycobacteriales bacterium]